MTAINAICGSNKYLQQVCNSANTVNYCVTGSATDQEFSVIGVTTGYRRKCLTFYYTTGSYVYSNDRTAF